MSGLSHNREEVPEVFEAFVEACDVELGPILRGIGLSETEVIVRPPGCAVRFKSKDLHLTFHYEFEGQLWATVDVCQGASWKQFSLDRLLKTTSPDLYMQIKRPEVSVHESLAVYAKAIREGQVLIP